MSDALKTFLDVSYSITVNLTTLLHWTLTQWYFSAALIAPLTFELVNEDRIKPKKKCINILIWTLNASVLALMTLLQTL